MSKKQRAKRYKGRPPPSRFKVLRAARWIARKERRYQDARVENEDPNEDEHEA